MILYSIPHPSSGLQDSNFFYNSVCVKYCTVHLEERWNKFQKIVALDALDSSEFLKISYDNLKKEH